MKGMRFFNYKNYLLLAERVFPWVMVCLAWHVVYKPFRWIPIHPLFILTVLCALLLPFSIQFFILNKSHRKQILAVFLWVLPAFLLFYSFAIIRSLFAGSNVYFFNFVRLTPAYVVLAFIWTLLAFFKKQTLCVIFWLSSVYVVMMIYLFFKEIFFHTSLYTAIKAVFPGYNIRLYQNINLFLGLFCISASFLIFVKKTMGAVLLNLFLVSLALFLSSFVGGRAAFIACIVVLLAIYLNTILSARKWLSTICLILLVFGIVYIISRFVFFEKCITLQRIITLFHEGASKTRTTPLRQELFIQAIQLFLSSPKTFFIGAGLGQFQIHYGYVAQYTAMGMYPHNFILELLCEHGVVGLSLFTGMFYFPLKKAIQSIKAKRIPGVYQRVILYLIVYAFIISNVNGCLLSLFILTDFTFFALPMNREDSLLQTTS